MPVIYTWDNSDKTTLCYRLEGRWTWEELYQALGESRKVWNTVNHVVDVIVDLSASPGFPPGNILGHFRNVSAFYRDAKAGNTVVVGANDFFRMTLEVFYKVYIRPRQQPLGHSILVKDMQAARVTLAERRKGANSGS